jgi:hypothetical protein
MTDNLTESQLNEIIPGRYTVGWTDGQAYLAEPDVNRTAKQVVEALRHYLEEGATEWWCEFSVIPTTRRHLQFTDDNGDLIPTHLLNQSEQG